LRTENLYQQGNATKETFRYTVPAESPGFTTKH